MFLVILTICLQKLVFFFFFFFFYLFFFLVGVGVGGGVVNFQMGMELQVYKACS